MFVRRDSWPPSTYVDPSRSTGMHWLTGIRVWWCPSSALNQHIKRRRDIVLIVKSLEDRNRQWQIHTVQLDSKTGGMEQWTVKEVCPLFRAESLLTDIAICGYTMQTWWRCLLCPRTSWDTLFGQSDHILHAVRLRRQDINSSKLYLINLDEGPSSLQEIDTKMPIGVTADIQGIDSSQIVLAGAKDGVTKFNLKTSEHEYIAKYWSGPDAEDKARR